ncbi:twin-arginine translocase subunit TatC [Alteromonas pelagimontana]|uniref:Sec-independent protein translocase protein TatC n=1 Tax=Alteromonas pelagimontana TaxID=1858656 RepID=A0A6M4MJY7_9ALTE|nr:twin-arginine translocase subunit TatC [Alteromonas pelagimontana]QJR82406.1 twin-arginine translocase subunit TatC [Alteromonas pelagimontana]
MNQENLDLSRAPLLAHLTELRTRLLYCLLFFAAAFGIAYYFANDIYRFLQQPLVEIFGAQSGRRMIYTSLQEAFFTYLKLSFFTALFFTLPLMLMQLWRFLAPGLYLHERKSLIPLFCMTPVLFIAGGALAFYVVMPMAWEFFISFETTGTQQAINVELEAKVSEYLSLVIKLILAFGLSFELPVCLLVMAKAGLVTAETLKRYRRHAIVIIFLLAALITPPDLISQIALGTPIILLYELSIMMISWMQKQQQKESQQAVSDL